MSRTLLARVLELTLEARDSTSKQWTMALNVVPGFLVSQTNSSFTVYDSDNVYDITGHTVADIWYLETGQTTQQHWPKGTAHHIAFESGRRGG